MDENKLNDLKIGSVIDDKYKIIAQIGKGGMSKVWLALNEKVNKQWAVKEVKRFKKVGNQVITQNIMQEVGILTHLRHEHLPSIVDVIVTDEKILIVMDYIQGRTLKDIIDEKGTLDYREVVDWSIQLCEVLSYLHNRKPAIIYRDIKPANIMLEPSGNIMLIDFGTAREYKEENLLEDTTCLGTRGYAAPEQYGGAGQTDERTDIYNLGATMYHLVTGKNPSKPPYEMRPVREWSPYISSGLEQIILKATESDPNKRYQSVDDLQYALEHYEELEEGYIRKMNKNKNIFLVLFLAGIISLSSAFGSKAYANNLNKNVFDEQIQLARISSKKDEKIELYKNAIIANPKNDEVYLELLNDVFLSDGKFTPDESNSLNSILGYKGKSSSDKTNMDKLKENKEGYERFSYNMGLAYFYYYNSDGNKQLSRPWFEVSKNSKNLPENQVKRSEKFYQIANYYSNLKNVDKAGDSKISYKDYWNDLVLLTAGDIAKEDNPKTALIIYKEFSNQVGVHCQDFKNSGVKKEDMIESLDNIEKNIDEISKNKKFDKKANENLIKDIKNNIEESKNNIDIAFASRT